MTGQAGGLLAQKRPATTDLTELVEASGLSVQLTRIIVCNVTASAANFDLYHRVETGDPSEDDAIWFNKEVAGGDSFVTPDELGVVLNDGHRLYMKSYTASAIVVSVYGRAATSGKSPSRMLAPANVLGSAR